MMLKTIKNTGGNKIKRLVIVPPYKTNGNLEQLLVLNWNVW